MREGGILAGLEQLLRIELTEQLDELRYHACPSALRRRELVTEVSQEAFALVADRVRVGSR